MLPKTRISIPKDILSQRIDDEMVVLNITTGEYFGLRAESSRAWELLQEDKNPRQVATVLAEEFDATKERIENDLAQFLDDLRRRHLIGS